MKAGTGDDIMADTTTGVLQANSPAIPGSIWPLVKGYVSLFKLRIVGLLLFIAMLAALTADGGLPPISSLLLLAAGGGLASAGASALNHYIDRDMDGLMPRTQTRILASGRLPHPGVAAALGVGLLLFSVPFSLRLGVPVAAYTLLGAFVYVVIYTLWLKRRSSLNIIIGGLSGSFAVLAGWSMVNPSISPFPLLIAALVFLWTPLHFWNFALVHLEQYRLASVPMMPVILGRAMAGRHICLNAASLFLLSLVPYFMGYMGPVYLVAALGLGILLRGNLKLLRRPTAQTAWANYKLSGPYLAGLFIAMAADSIL
ncbi:MAG: heme o synthase [Dehalococcoidia bacterium]|jgi:protoheme IX farnesyltransferase|nr:heme o synthase [Dehalococcoidia bacterium]